MCSVRPIPGRSAECVPARSGWSRNRPWLTTPWACSLCCWCSCLDGFRLTGGTSPNSSHALRHCWHHSQEQTDSPAPSHALRHFCQPSSNACHSHHASHGGILTACSTGLRAAGGLAPPLATIRIATPILTHRILGLRVLRSRGQQRPRCWSSHHRSGWSWCWHSDRSPQFLVKRMLHLRQGAPSDSDRIPRIRSATSLPARLDAERILRLRGCNSEHSVGLK